MDRKPPDRSICRSVGRSVYPFVHLSSSTHLPMYPCIYPHIHASIDPSIHPFMYAYITLITSHPYLHTYRAQITVVCLIFVSSVPPVIIQQDFHMCQVLNQQTSCTFWYRYCLFLYVYVKEYVSAFVFRYFVLGTILHTGDRSDEKFENDVLLVALRWPKNSNPGAVYPEVMKLELCL